MLDSLDQELILRLEEDASQNSDELASQLSVSAATIRRRKRGLIENGAIHIVAIPEPKHIGLPLSVIVAFQVVHEKANSILKTPGSRKDVKCLYATSGRFDLIALMWSASTEKLFEFIEKDVGKLDGVKTTETFICLHAEKSF